MATNSSSKSPELIDNTWMNQSPGDRLRSIEQMQKSGSAAQATLLRIASSDEHLPVRCGAVRYLRDLTILIELQQAEAEVAEAAAQQYHRILAGTADADVSEQDRLDIIKSLPLAAAKQIALLTKSKIAGDAALAHAYEAEDLADLALFAASVHVRKLAAMKIDDKKLLKELQEKVRDKDKTVFKVINQALTAIPVATESPLKPEIETKPAPTDAAKKPAKAVIAKKPPKLDPAAELPGIEKQLTKLSHKHTDALNSLRNSLNKIRKSIPAESVELTESATKLHDLLTEKLEKNHTHQEQLQTSTATLLEKLQQALDAGQSHEALPTWDKIQGNISNTSGKIRAALQKQANVNKAKLNELRDWKAFAATEKKKELITQMQHLLESKMHAADRSKHISKMHQEWKLLGRSNQNEQLWREFKKLSDKAYEPCKEYFKQRKHLMAENFIKRREVCEQLEAELGKIESEELNISQLNKLLHQADQDWKAHAPIEQSKIKPLQKRYYAVINQLRKTRKNSLRENGTQKLEFIAKAKALAELEDNQQAMRDAKQLQQEWKKVGPTSFKEDKKYWEEFRAACDKIFEKRNQEAKVEQDNLQQSEAKLVELLQGIEAIFKLEDEAFRSARSDYQTLAQQFSNSLEPRLRNQVKRLQEQFNGLKRKIDSRFKTLPDKKQLLLKNSVLEKARFLQQIEEKLLACTDDVQFFEIKNSIDNSTFNNIEISGDNNYDQALHERLLRIQQAASLAALRGIADECAAKARALCIELEIRANIDTPKEDQGLRMQIQLDQLKNGFGKSKPDPKENSSYAMDIELQSYCLGPLEAHMQAQISQRLEGAIKKLL